MEKWLAAALDYLPRWLDYQMLATEQPGCAIAVAHKGKLVLEHAFGHADLKQGTKLTPRHRFRVASHSKTFTAAGIMKLREARRIGLDDRIGHHVKGLHPAVARRRRIAQLLSHTAGLVRDGADSGQWTDRRPFLDEAALRADLARGTVIEPSTRFKYSNHGYGLLGLAIEVDHRRAVRRLDRARDRRRPGSARPPPTRRWPWLRRRCRSRAAIRPSCRSDGASSFPATTATHALAAATGFVSTAADLARFFASLSPTARKSVLSVASRREMIRRHWRDPHSSLERWYGLGTICGNARRLVWFGHSGGFQGTITRTVCVPAQELAVSVLTNATDGAAHAWLDGTLHMLRAFARTARRRGSTAAWSGRWWSLWGAVDLLPIRARCWSPIRCSPTRCSTRARSRSPAATATAGIGAGRPGRRLRQSWRAGANASSTAAARPRNSGSRAARCCRRRRSKGSCYARYE